MTSSLVGSEMCIRDSYLNSKGPPSMVPQQDMLWVPLCTLCAMMSRYPVSYTHLTLPTICSV
eukprot:10803428-Prorocentrum_lima.AAC.1